MLDKKNTVLAILLSVAVMFGWQYFVAGPRFEAQRKAIQAEEAAKRELAGQGQVAAPQGGQAPQVAQPGVAPTPQPAAVSAFADRATVLAASPRVPIDTPAVQGSISLKGGRLDDLVLKDHRETVDKSSPPVTLLEPFGTANAYFAETGWLPDAGQPVEVPTTETLWTLASGTTLAPDHPVTLSWTNAKGFVFKRVITVDERYLFSITDQIEAPEGQAAKAVPYSTIRRFGLPHTSGYYILHEGPIGVFGDEGLKEIKYPDLIKSVKVEPAKGAGHWSGFVDKYWATALVPDKARTEQTLFTAAKTATGTETFQTVMVGEPQVVGAGSAATASVNLFAGAKEVSAINAYKEKLGIDRFEKLIDWGWFWFITQPMFWLIDHAYKLFGNFGLAILAVTVIVKLAFFPLANKSYDSMSKMKKVQPEMKEIQERFKDDKAKQQQAMMELYKREKINPLSGCLPVVLQIPVFFSLYKVLFITIEMRHAPFFGWIKDLAAPDPTSVFNLFGLIPFHPPAMLMVGVWPLIMGVTMLVQMKMNPAPPDPTQKILFDWMPIIFTFMLASFPAGLVIYWAWNNFLSVLQQGYIMRRNGVRIEIMNNLRTMFRSG